MRVGQTFRWLPTATLVEFSLDMARTRYHGKLACAQLAMLPMLSGILGYAQNLTIQCVVRDDRKRAITDLRAEEMQITEDGKPVVLQSLKPGAGQAGLLSILVDSGSADSAGLARATVQDLLFELKERGVQIGVWDVKQTSLLRDYSPDWNSVTGVVSGTPYELKVISAKSVKISKEARRLVEEERRAPIFALLHALIEEQAESAGRKEILYFAAAGEESALTEEQVAALGSNALRAGVSVYVIEAAADSAQVAAKATALLTSKNQAAPAAKQNMWRELARRTGGAYTSAGKDNGRDTVRRAGEDFSVSYQATFATAAQTEDGHFRPVAVKVTRAKAVSQNAAGYFSVPGADIYALADFAPPLLQALQEKTDSDQLHFEAEVLRFGQEEGKTHASLVVEVPRSALTTMNNNDAQKLLRTHFAVYAQIRGGDGKIVSRYSEDEPYETALERANVAPRNIFMVEAPMTLEPGDYRAEIAVGDQYAANIGKKSLTFSITKPGSALTVGDVIVIRGVEARAATQAKDDPLALGAQSLIPWATRMVRERKGSELPVLLKIYGDAAAGNMPDVQLEVRRDKEMVANLPLLVSGVKAGQFQALVWLPEDSLEAGHYTLVAHAAQGELASEGRAEFDYVAGSQGGGLEDADAGPDLAPKQLMTAGPELIGGAKRPSEEEIKTILEAARGRALDYKKSLPNFTCLVTNKRFNSRTGVQNWKLKDNITELLRYVNGKEEHQIVAVNGVTKAGDQDEVKGLMTRGEFGEFLDAVFSPDAQAEFSWQGRTLVDGQEAHVFAYKVKRAHSIYSMTTVDGRSRIISAFHGIIHVDANTLVTRFVSIEAEDIPVQALYRESAVAVNYNYFTIEGEKYLLPKKAAVSVRIGRRSLSKIEMQFHDLRRYGASSTLIVQ